MSFVIPPLVSTDYSANVAQWANKFYIENYSKTSGILIATWYEIATLTNIEDVIYWLFLQENDPNEMDEYSFRVTIDTEVFEVANNGVTENTVQYLKMTAPTTIGSNSNVLAFNAALNTFDWQSDRGGAATDAEGRKKVGGHSLKFEWRIDEAVPAGQEVFSDIYYLKKETV